MLFGVWKKIRTVRGELVRMKAGIIGHFGEGENLLNGQTIKTKIVTEELQNQSIEKSTKITETLYANRNYRMFWRKCAF